jgi:hypothetical protein
MESVFLHGVVLNLEEYVTFYAPHIYCLTHMCLYRLLSFYTFHVILSPTEQWSHFSLFIHIHVPYAWVCFRPLIYLYTVFIYMFMIDRLVKLWHCAPVIARHTVWVCLGFLANQIECFFFRSLQFPGEKNSSVLKNAVPYLLTNPYQLTIRKHQSISFCYDVVETGFQSTRNEHIQMYVRL